MYHPLEAHIIEHPHRSFYDAIRSGNRESLVTRILDGFDVDHAECAHTPPLIYAIMHERAQAVETLLLYGANPNIKNHKGETPLHTAVKMQLPETLHLLLRYGADAALTDNNAVTPMQLARNQQNTEMLEILTNTPPMPVDDITLDEAVKTGNLPALIKAASQASLFKHCDDNLSLLHLCVHGGNLRVLCYLLNRGLNIDAADKDGNTTLCIAAQHEERLDILGFLLKRHASIDHKNNSGSTSLMLAIQSGNAAAVEILLREGANIHTAEGSNTPLTLCHDAIEIYPQEAKYFREIETTLLIKGAHVDLPTNQLKWTPLLNTVARQQDIKTRTHLDLLLRLGANVNYADANGRTALMLAASTGRKSAVEKLLDNYADSDKLDKYGWSALMFAVYYDHQAIARMLLEYGTDVNITSEKGINALKIATQYQRKLLINLLLDYGAIAEDENRE